MMYLLFPRQTIDDNIIKVKHNIFAYDLSEHMMHEHNEGTRWIGQTKRHG